MMPAPSVPPMGMFGKKKPPEPTPEVSADDRELDERERIVAWRYLMLLDLGFTPDDALHLLRNPLLDWHAAERLLRKGCSPELVIRLLEA